MLRGGGFRAHRRAAAVSIAELVYVRLRGGEPPGESTSSPSRAGAAPMPRPTMALARLTTLVTRFEDEATPYRSLVLSMWTAPLRHL